MNLVPPAELFSNPEPKDRIVKKRKKFIKKKRLSNPTEMDEEAAKKMKLFVQTKDTSGSSPSGSIATGGQEEETSAPLTNSAAAEEAAVEADTNKSRDCEKEQAPMIPGDEQDTNVDPPEARSLDETITLTQIHEKYKFVGESSEEDSPSEEDEEAKEKRKELKRLTKQKLKQKDEEKVKRKKLFSSPLILIQSLKVINSL